MRTRGFFSDATFFLSFSSNFNMRDIVRSWVRIPLRLLIWPSCKHPFLYPRSSEVGGGPDSFLPPRPPRPPPPRPPRLFPPRPDPPRPGLPTRPPPPPLRPSKLRLIGDFPSPEPTGLTSEVANWMFMGRPSNGTPLYCFIALMASLLRSKMTSADPKLRPDLS